MVQELTEPKMDWREIIQQQIMSTMKSDYTWMRPSRKSWHTSAILPGQNNDEMIDICLSLDASGSISDKQCKEFLSEVILNDKVIGVGKGKSKKSAQQHAAKQALSTVS